MAFGNMIPSEASTVSIAKQSVQGTGVTATNVLRGTTLSPQPNVPPLEDDSIQGFSSKVSGLQIGQKSTSYGLDGPLYASEAGWPLASLLADAVGTGASDPYTWTFAALNTAPMQSKYHTITDWNGSDGVQYVDSKCNEWSMSVSADQLATQSSKWDGVSVTTTTQPAISADASSVALPSFLATLSINSLSGPKTTAAMVDVKRTNTPLPAIGAASVGAIFNGADVDYTGSATVVYDSTNGITILGYYTAGTIVPIVLNLDTGATPDRQVQTTATQCLIDKATVVRDLGKYMVLNITWHGVGNATDQGASLGHSPCKVQLKAGLAAAVYA